MTSVTISRDSVATSTAASAAGLEIRAATGGGRPVLVDLSEFSLVGGTRQQPIPLLILANAALGVAQRAPVSISLPTDDVARLAILRSGILFAVASSAGIHGHSPIVGMAPDVVSKWLELWSRPWSPHEPILGRLFDDEPRVVDGREFSGPGGILKNKSNAKRATRVIVDPHPRGREFVREQCAGKLAGSWLSAVIPSSQNTEVALRRNVWAGVVTQRVLVEPLLNVVDHAFKRPAGETTTVPYQRSFMLLARTDGGGVESHPRLHLLVADGGYGLVQTLRPKLSVSDNQAEAAMAECSAEEILGFAVGRPAMTAADPGLPWARSGFAHAVDEAVRTGVIDDDRLNYEFTVLTGDPDTNGTLIARCTVDGKVNTEAQAMPFIGTCVLVTLPVPHGGSSTTRQVEEDSVAGVAVAR